MDGLEFTAVNKIIGFGGSDSRGEHFQKVYRGKLNVPILRGPNYVDYRGVTIITLPLIIGRPLIGSQRTWTTFVLEEFAVLNSCRFTAVKKFTVVNNRVDALLQDATRSDVCARIESTRIQSRIN